MFKSLETLPLPGVLTTLWIKKPGELHNKTGSS